MDREELAKKVLFLTGQTQEEEEEELNGYDYNQGIMGYDA